jgi:hypothetical protein
MLLCINGKEKKRGELSQWFSSRVKVVVSDERGNSTVVLLWKMLKFLPRLQLVRTSCRSCPRILAYWPAHAIDPSGSVILLMKPTRCSLLYHKNCNICPTASFLYKVLILIRHPREFVPQRHEVAPRYHSMNIPTHYNSAPSTSKKIHTNNNRNLYVYLFFGERGDRGAPRAGRSEFTWRAFWDSPLLPAASPGTR